MSPLRIANGYASALEGNLSEATVGFRRFEVVESAEPAVIKMTAIATYQSGLRRSMKFGQEELDAARHEVEAGASLLKTAHRMMIRGLARTVARRPEDDLPVDWLRHVAVHLSRSCGSCVWLSREDDALSSAFAIYQDGICLEEAENEGEADLEPVLKAGLLRATAGRESDFISFYQRAFGSSRFPLHLVAEEGRVLATPKELTLELAQKLRVV